MGKRQAFRLAPVLRVRQAAERAASLAHVEAESAARQAERRAEELAGALAEHPLVRSVHVAHGPVRGARLVQDPAPAGL